MQPYTQQGHMLDNAVRCLGCFLLGWNPLVVFAVLSEQEGLS